jgi:carbon storage regulator CsrA
MLVLSRGQNDRIVFPSLGITVEVVKLAGSRARLGVVAPKSIRVMRHELLDEEAEKEIAEFQAAADIDSLSHETRNQINRATLKLQLAAKMLESGADTNALTYLTQALSDLDEISVSDDVADHAKSTRTAISEQTVGESAALFQTNKKKAGARRILLVDDDANERVLLASYLKQCGFDVVEAEDGLAALYQLSNRERPDVVLMDMNMPNMDGKETLERIRTTSQHPGVPVIAVTGEDLESSSVAVSEEGFTAWFQKPVHADQLVEIIEQSLATV